MSSQPTIPPSALRDHLQSVFETLCAEVTTAVNEAQPGHLIDHSEEKVRTLLADFRQTTFQTALQLRLDAAQAAFPPSEAPSHRATAPEQGT